MNVPPLEESTWVRQASQGDREAFARLVDAYWENVRRWLYGLTGKQHLAEDVAQETFLKAWTALPNLREAATFRVWLFRIARHCWLDARRRSRVQRKVPLGLAIPSKEAGPLTEIIGNEAQEKLQDALDLLPAKFRAAYLLWTQQELPYSEIAEILGVSEETARWRVCKARQSLLQMMNSYLHCRDA
ncbi:MAG: RNA polymerase sigma factor [Planctomycetes bacterium]|nr:RNA polymerase sigma factor [Planctomycetota bacterium]